jgi:3-oxoacyl-[acyl-carrier protein] reductase
MMGNQKRLQDRVAIVTGGVRGIGRAIAEAFATEGADVAICDIASEQDAQAVVDFARGQGRTAIFISTDVSDEAQVARMVDVVSRSFPRIDVLVNNAGILSKSLLVHMQTEEWDRVMAVNLRGTFLCTRYVLPHMLRQQYGRIINIASQRGQIGGIGLTHYSASKGGVIAFTKALAREVVRDNVLVNAIAPGPIATELNAPYMEDWSQRIDQVPSGRMGRPDEVAPTAVFLASEDATYYVGQTLGPNGGDVML